MKKAVYAVELWIIQQMTVHKANKCLLVVDRNSDPMPLLVDSSKDSGRPRTAQGPVAG